MRTRQISLVLLCEDTAQDSFIRGLLKERKYNLDKVRTKIHSRGKDDANAGKGDAKAGIHAKYPDEVRALRRYCTKNASLTLGLIAVRDGDNESPQDVHKRFATDLASGSQKPRESGEAIAEFVPCRTIETWALYLGGDASVNEVTDYTKTASFRTQKDRSEKCRAGGRLFADYEPDGNAPPSLIDGCKERDRIPKG